MGHDWAGNIVKHCSELVTSVSKALLDIAKTVGIKRLLITSNKTRLTCVHASMQSVVWLRATAGRLLQNQQMNAAQCLQLFASRHEGIYKLGEAACKRLPAAGLFELIAPVVDGRTG